MPELTPSGAVDVVERQVRRVRRRKNLYELQRALYLAVGAAGVTAILLLPLALFARSDVFGAAAWSTLAALVVVSLTLVRQATRRWLTRTEAVAWIERRGALGGRVRTLLELGREPALATGFFHPLLVSEVDATLATWTPRRLVPRRIPGGALAAALGVLLALAAVLRLAALVAPTAPAAGLDHRPGAPASETALRDRVIVAPGVAARADERSVAGGAPRADSRLARLSSALQENVREQVWGKAWERVRDALARAGTRGSPNLDGDETMDDAQMDVEGTDDRRLAQRDRRSGTRRGAAGKSEDEPSGDEDADPSARAEAADDPHAGGDGANGGAGNATSPGDLFTGTRVDTSDTNASFELSLAARMRNDEAGRLQAGGAAPEADPDTRPALATDQRREAAAHRTTIPAAYEQVVRQVFAHREEP